MNEFSPILTDGRHEKKGKENILTSLIQFDKGQMTNID